MRPLPVAVDLMGGDLGPEPVIAGAVRAAVDDGARVVLVGPHAVGARLASEHPASFTDGRLAFVAAEDVVTMDDAPAHAARRKRGSSMRVACNLVADGRCAAVVSTGNSGALLATASVSVGRLDGVVRPAIAVTMPALGGKRVLLLDAGANTECTPVMLAQWGVLGSAWMRVVAGVPRPVVAVLGNGEEAHKGTVLTRGALALLVQTDAQLAGACEGRDIHAGVVDVVVTDGFTGNVALKTAEGVFSLLTATVRDTFANGSVVDRVAGALSQPGWARIRAALDPREFGAAPLLGLRRPVLVAHGKSDAHAIRCAVRAARHVVDARADEALVAALARNAAVLRGADGDPDDADGDATGQGAVS